MKKKYSAILTRVCRRPPIASHRKTSPSAEEVLLVHHTPTSPPEPASPSTRRTGSRTPSRWVPRCAARAPRPPAAPFQPLLRSPVYCLKLKCLTVTGGGGGSRLANSSATPGAPPTRLRPLHVPLRTPPTRVGELASKRPRRESGRDIRSRRLPRVVGSEDVHPKRGEGDESEPEPEPEPEPESSEYESSESLSEPSPSEDERPSEPSDRATNARMRGRRITSPRVHPEEVPGLAPTNVAAGINSARRRQAPRV